MEIARAHQSMMLSKIISTTQTALLSVIKKLVLPKNLIADPIEMHNHSFGMFLVDVVISNTAGSAIISDNRGRRLGMTKFSKDVSNSISLFAIVKQGRQFGLGSTG